MKRAFTLIELLVVIAIIAILAAILFPVFAQAKAAAKTTQSLSNMKQIGTGIKMYVSDYDDTLPTRKYTVVAPSGNYGFSWKNMIYPYVKNTAMYIDPMNEAAKYPDDTAQLGVTPNLPPTDQPIFRRGYAYADIPFLHRKSWDAQTITDTTLENPAGTLVIAEHKRVWVDCGPYLDWTTGGEYPNDPAAGFKYQWGGNKWDNKAMVLVFHDGHAKRAANTQICGRNDEMNMWGYQRNQLNAWGGLGDVQWLDTFCTSMPQAVK
jgi:prepilin-type N-terminal cleavage/methylation domain-containing protein